VARDAGQTCREPRVSFEVEVLAFPRNRMVHCQGIDVSTSGMLLRTPTPLSDHEPLSLVFPLVTQENGEPTVQWVGACGRLVRRVGQGTVLAVRFEDPLPWIALLLDAHVRRRLVGGEGVVGGRNSPGSAYRPQRGSRAGRVFRSQCGG
jgi:hypothetical protein